MEKLPDELIIEIGKYGCSYELSMVCKRFYKLIPKEHKIYKLDVVLPDYSKFINLMELDLIKKGLTELPKLPNVKVHFQL